MTTEKEDVRRLQACLKVCEGVTTEELESLALVGGLPALKTGIEVLLGWWKQCNDERARAQRVADARLSALVFTHNLKKTARQRAAIAEKQRGELLVSLENALEWIDAVPSDTQLPAMPGFDRDEVNQLISDIKKDRL